ncbi:MAG TPA: hypothetical protein VFG00_13385 [Acidothermaceae bacterium]|nr:hypothetical protein [Acidothermaceae bacterium]
MRADTALAALLADYPHLRLPGPEIVPQLVLSSLLDGSATVGSGRRAEVVVFAVDGISWPVLDNVCATADLRVPYRSTFPSTSLVSWLAAVGLPPGSHPVAGPVFATRPELTSNLIADNDVGWGGVDPARPELPAGHAGTSMFETLGGHGLASEVMVGDFYGISESWLSLLTRGATRCDPSRSLDAIRLSPAALQETAVHDLLARQRSGPAAVRWVYINFDDRIHKTGYDDEVLTALRSVIHTAERLARDGYTTFVHSDHGHIRNVTSAADQAIWGSVDVPELCTAPAGGAGRVRWLYPRPGAAASILTRLRDSFGDEVGIFARDSQQWHDFGAACGNPHLTSDAVGEVVIVALSNRFPVPDPGYAFEHGSICADEMTTGVAVWSGV